MKNKLSKHSYKNMFINCTSISFDEPETETEHTDVQPIATDGFDWTSDMENAYRCPLDDTGDTFFV